ncbi:MAG: hypothetical protein ACPIA2_17000, partial [Mariniblastus sp.]
MSSLLTVFLLTSVSCQKGNEGREPVSAPKTEVEQSVTGLIASEDLILDLTPQLRQIASWIEQRKVGSAF